MIIGILAAIALTALVTGATIAVLTAMTVFGWIDENTVPSAKTAQIIRRKLGNGEYRVISGVYNRKKNPITSTEWIAEELDDELHEYFEDTDKVRIEI